MKTTIWFKVGSSWEKWEVPRGFGAEYRRAIEDDLSLVAKPNAGVILDIIQDSLALVGYAVTREQIAGWPLRKRVEARVYALREYLVAGDNPLQRHPKPEWLPEPWKGPESGEGIWAGPAPTEVP